MLNTPMKPSAALTDKKKRRRSSFGRKSWAPPRSALTADLLSSHVVPPSIDPDKKVGAKLTVLLVGPPGSGRHTIATELSKAVQSMKDLTLDLRSCESLPLPQDQEEGNKESRPRIDFVVLFVDMTNLANFTDLHKSIHYLDLRYLLGKALVLATHVDERSAHSMTSEDIIGTTEAVGLSHIFANLADAVQRTQVARQVLKAAKTANHLLADPTVTPLLLNTLQPAVIEHTSRDLTA